jgi:formate-dependent nitrite reductase membrane component NrfD
VSERSEGGMTARWLRSAVGPVEVESHQEPPPSAGEREARWVKGRGRRDVTPAVGSRGAPGRYKRAVEGAAVALAKRAWGDARWSFLFRSDTGYATERPGPDEVALAARRARTGPLPDAVNGPIILTPVWSWEVPVYFWFGGMAAGSAFAALACDLAGDSRSAATARKVALGSVAACPALLVGDLGRPLRFLNMLRIFKPRSPMSMGSWCLFTFGGLAAAGVGADLLERPRLARALGAANGLVAGYLGSYTGVLLAATAVPVWSRSRLFLGPVFVATATATGASATRLVLTASGLPSGHPTREALGRVEAGAMLAELTLASINERRLGPLGSVLRRGAAGRLFRGAELGVAVGLGLGFLRSRLGPRAQHAASVLYLGAGLAFRAAWVMAGRASSADAEGVARAARAGRGGPGDLAHAPGDNSD